jgi:hypothetical protein
LLLQELPFNQRLTRRQVLLNLRQQVQQVQVVVLLQVEDLRVAVLVDQLLHVTTVALLLEKKVAPNPRKQLRSKIK